MITEYKGIIYHIAPLPKEPSVPGSKRTTSSPYSNTFKDFSGTSKALICYAKYVNLTKTLFGLLYHLKRAFDQLPLSRVTDVQDSRCAQAIYSRPADKVRLSTMNRYQQHNQSVQLLSSMRKVLYEGFTLTRTMQLHYALNPGSTIVQLLWHRHRAMPSHIHKEDPHVALIIARSH